MYQNQNQQKYYPPSEKWVFTPDWYKNVYLKSPHWRALTTALITNNPGAKCWICQKTNTLLLHHVQYVNLYNELLFRDVYVLCFDCHTEVHFKGWNNEKVPLIKDVLVKRMIFLKRTYRIRKFRLGSAINAFFAYLYNEYSLSDPEY